MDLEPTGDESAKCCQCCNCGCDCSTAAQSCGDGIRTVKQKHDELERGHDNQSFDSVARVEIGDECAALREAVSSQQQAIKDLCDELEEERNAASTAANEAMSMILRLQREKAEIQMEARQFKRFAEERSSHDQQELLALEDLLYKREQAIHSLTCEIQAYKHRLMSFGFTESEVEGYEYEIPPYEYPPLRCNVMHSAADADNDDDGGGGDADVEKYVFGETPRDRLRNLENRISQMEMERTPTYSQMDGDFAGKNFMEKVVVGQSPRRTKHSRKFSSCDSASLGPELLMDSPRLNGSFRKINEEHPNLTMVDNAAPEAGDDDMSDRVYTIDSVYNGAPCNGFTEFEAGAGGAYGDYATTPMDLLGNQDDFEDPYVKKLYMRLQALEADRESMKQAIISMRTDKAQLVLLKEIAQQLCKDMSPHRKRMARKPFSMPFVTVFEWITSIVFWRKRAHQIKYMFRLPTECAGLLMLLDKGHRVQTRRYLSSTQLGDY